MQPPTSFLNATKLDHAIWKNTHLSAHRSAFLRAEVSDHAPECRLEQMVFRGQVQELLTHKRAFVNWTGLKRVRARPPARASRISKSMVRQLKTMENAQHAGGTLHQPLAGESAWRASNLHAQ